MHIENIGPRATEILQFRFAYALEKIHGTSAHIELKPIQYMEHDEGPTTFFPAELKFFSGGENYAKFVGLFHEAELKQKFLDKFGDQQKVVIYGEAYGGKQQGMSATYGPELKFIVFDVRVGDAWLSVDKAFDVATGLGLEFVDFSLVPTDIESLEAERNKPSTQAKRNGIQEEKKREGIVLRPPFELTLNNGKRIIAKFKNEEFSERKSSPNLLDPSKQVLLQDAQNVAFEWVVPERLNHVINRLISSREDKEISIKDTSSIIRLMVEDVGREAFGEIPDTKEVRKAIGSQAVKLFKQYLQEQVRQATKTLSPNTNNYEELPTALWVGSNPCPTAPNNGN